jgi:hypothetical protein
MTARVAVAANTYGFAEGGGHLWAYLNWALSLRAAGCDVLWVERVPEGESRSAAEANAAALRDRLAPYGLADAIVLASWADYSIPALDGYASAEAVADADLLLSLIYEPARTVRARRNALLDIDPGLLQIWASEGWVDIDGYDVYFSIGETVGASDARFPDAGRVWNHTPPCVALEWWEPSPRPDEGAFTTVSNWGTYDEWMPDGNEWYSNDKREGFVPFLELPRRTRQPLELALCLAPDQEDERSALIDRGWRVRHAYEVASTPWDYQRYIAQSLGEFSCVKPSCVRLQNAWVSDRTLCYLAAGRPAVVEYTGPSRVLQSEGGVFRFKTIDEAARALEAVADDYDSHSRLARELAEERFDGVRVASDLLARALN